MMGSCASVLVEYDRGLRWLRDGIAYAERTERFNDRHYMTAHLARVLWAIGDWPAAAVRARHALADGRGGITTRITALHVLGYLALVGKDWSTANTHLAEVSLHSGDARAAASFCERGFSESAAVDDAAYLFPYLVTGARAYLALDDLAGARSWVERCGQVRGGGSGRVRRL